MGFRFLSSCLITILLLVFGVISVVNAVSPGSIIVDLVPENPAPYENVDIKLSSFAANLDSVLITWFVNGQNTLSGIGKKSFSITAGAAGSEVTVSAKISLPDGEIEKTILIRPNNATLLWQANDSYVPPFYRGKAMPTSDSEIKIVAMPEIKTASGTVDSKNMVYSWLKDYSNEVAGSGYGKNFFLYVSDYLDSSNNIEVVASTVDGNYSSKASLNVSTISPQISFYKKYNDLGVLWERTMENGDMVKDGEILVAIPYFISPKEIQNPILKWSWFINDSLVSTPSFLKNLMPLRVESGTSGRSKLKVVIENQYQVFQTANKEIELGF